MGYEINWKIIIIFNRSSSGVSLSLIIIIFFLPFAVLVSDPTFLLQQQVTSVERKHGRS